MLILLIVIFLAMLTISNNALIGTAIFLFYFLFNVKVGLSTVSMLISYNTFRYSYCYRISRRELSGLDHVDQGMP